MLATPNGFIPVQKILAQNEAYMKQSKVMVEKNHELHKELEKAYNRINQLETCNRNVLSALNELDSGNLDSFLSVIDKIIINKPATIITYKDGSPKTVVKCCKGDTYDEQLGIERALVKGIIERRGFSRNRLDKFIQSKVVKQETKTFAPASGKYGFT